MYNIIKYGKDKFSNYTEILAKDSYIKLLESNGILGQTELRGTKKVLGAAALTYVAGAATAIIQLARLILIAGGRDRD